MQNNKHLENFIKDWKNVKIKLNKNDWNNISMNYELSEDFIINFSEYLNWTLIYKYQHLTQHLIKNGNYVIDKFTYITKFQKLSEEFIIENINDLNLKLIWSNQTYSENLLKKIIKLINLNDWNIISYTIKITDLNLLQYINKNHNWLYLDYNLRVNLISKYYNIIVIENDKYVECYKSVRSNFSSIYAPHIKYNKFNEFYETACDYNYNNYNSFGFGGWSYDDAKKFAHSKKIKNYKIIKIIIPIESCCLITNFSYEKGTMNININNTMFKKPFYLHNPKIRCNKFKITDFVQISKLLICKKSRFLH